jgi:hypothetical protein
MDQKSIVLYLSLKKMRAVEIHADLVATLKIEAVWHGSITRHLRSRSFTASIDPGQSEQRDLILTESDMAILTALEKQPLSSVRQFRRATNLTLSTVYCPLTEKLGYIVRYFR